MNFYHDVQCAPVLRALTNRSSLATVCVVIFEAVRGRLLVTGSRVQPDNNLCRGRNCDGQSDNGTCLYYIKYHLVS
jgi:hypothetical protein